MADQIDENGNSINTAENNASETAEERASRLEETNRKLYERAKKAEAEAKELKAKVSEAKPAISEQQNYKPSDILKADEFKLYRQGYNESEIDIIMHNGGAKILEDKKNPLVLGLEASRQQRSAEDAASKVNDSTGASDIERKFTKQQMRAMSKEDLAKLLPHTE